MVGFNCTLLSFCVVCFLWVFIVGFVVCFDCWAVYFAFCLICFIVACCMYLLVTWLCYLVRFVVCLIVIGGGLA